jgi:RNA polymerase sigma factor (sigma-70 family)
MTTTHAGIVLRHLHRALAAPHGDALPDRLLLQRFVAGRDEVAFAALVRRHGPLVLGVCRRVLGCVQDAEDAFQATFLVLARKAATVRRHQSLAGWLHRVAYHLAVRARTQAAARRRHERQAPPRRAGDPLEELTGRELLAALDEELRALPACYREPLVLCHLQGRTRDEAAAALGCSASTLKRRLAAGRHRLRSRLQRRGLALSAGLLAAGVTAAPTPPALAASAVRTAVQAMSGDQAAVPAAVAALAQGALRAAVVARMVLGGMLLLAAGLVALGVGQAGTRLPAEPPPIATAAPAAPARDNERMTVGGRVLGADGKPLAGAVVAVVGRARRQYRSGDPKADRVVLLGTGRTDAAGRCQFTARRTASARFWEVWAVAAAPGYALRWQRLGPDAEQQQVALRLPPEQVIRARLMDLLGLPAAGVKVSVSWQGREVRGEFDGVRLGEVRGLPPGLWPAPVVTDGQGRFAIRGLRRDQGITLRAEGNRFAEHSFEIRPVGQPRAERKVYGIDAGGYMNTHRVGPDAGQPEEPAFTLSPAHVLEGRVLYADTGKPAAGVRVLDTLTDADGRFRVRLGDSSEVTVIAYPPEGQPYFSAHRRVHWPRAELRQQIEIRLPRGMLVRSKVADSATGLPIAGACVQYQAREGNRDLPRNAVTGFDRLELSRADGTFAITVPPGPGYLLVQGPTPDYVHQEIDSEVVRTGRTGGERLYPDAAVKLDVGPKGDVPDLFIRLRRGVTVRGRLLGPDGTPVAHAVVLHRLHIYHDLSWHFATEARDGVFEIHGLAPEQTVNVFFLDARKRCGTVVPISGKLAGREITVRLAPCGQARARYADDRGQPQANLQVSPEIVITPGRPLNDRGPREGVLAADAGDLVNLDRYNYWGNVKTDAAGRVTFPALIPGATYRLRRFDKDNWVVHKEFVAESGKTIDLGDVPMRSRE